MFNNKPKVNCSLHSGIYCACCKCLRATINSQDMKHREKMRSRAALAVLVSQQLTFTCIASIPGMKAQIF